MSINVIVRVSLGLFATSLVPGAFAQSASGNFAQCLACHSIEKGAPHAVGPNLNGVFGKPIAGASGYVFSKSLRARGGSWTEESLHQWLESPQSYAPGTKMAFAGLKDPAARQEVIDVLKSLH
ncbi:cytochrome c family protein [Azoarcus sp. KH32C]|uniref:c-type cytochrome n=1 Tax=Azoarcus sp. KH32C TaxID=748247 RepID=UPI0002386603|nr:c-type cytochrome [Azoarcus sp. KH32C]BAL24194.1 cytochrome c, class I [Azoarcus sp. KH32C]